MNSTVSCSPGFSGRDFYEYFEGVCLDQSFYKIPPPILILSNVMLLVITSRYIFHSRERLSKGVFQLRDLLLVEGVLGSVLRIGVSASMLATGQVAVDGSTVFKVFYALANVVQIASACTFNYLVGTICAAIVGSPLAEDILKWNRFGLIYCALIGVLAAVTFGIIPVFMQSTKYFYMGLILSMFCDQTYIFALSLKIYFYKQPDYTNVQSVFRVLQRKIMFGSTGFLLYTYAVVGVFIWMLTCQNDPKNLIVFASGRYIELAMYVSVDVYNLLALFAMFTYVKHPERKSTTVTLESVSFGATQT